VHERTQVPLLASLLLSIKFLAWIRLVLVGVIEPLEGCVGQLARIIAATACLLIIVLALFSIVVELIGRPPVIEGLVRIYAMIPVVVFRLVCTERSLIAVHIEHQGVNSL